MALFSKKKKSEDAPVVAKKATPAVAGVPKEPKTSKTTKKAEPVKVATPKTASLGKGDYSSLLMRPRITEKASLKGESQNVYVFEVARNANKETIYKAIVDVYNVVPVKIAIAQTPSKNVFSRGRRGVQVGVKKAYVYLNKGEKIEVI